MDHDERAKVLLDLLAECLDRYGIEVESASIPFAPGLRRASKTWPLLPEDYELTRKAAPANMRPIAEDVAEQIVRSVATAPRRRIVCAELPRLHAAHRSRAEERGLVTFLVSGYDMANDTETLRMDVAYDVR